MVRCRTISMRFAHSAGQCGAACTSDGTVLVTSGSDCAVRVHDIRTAKESEPWWADDRNDGPNATELTLSGIPEKPLNAVAVTSSNNLFATACDDGFVRLYSLSVEAKENIQAEAAIVGSTRFGGSVKALAFSPTGAFLAAAGDEPGVIKLIMTAQPSNVTVLRAASGGGSEAVRAISFDPLSDFLVTVSERGTACIWSVDSGGFVCAIRLDNRYAKSVAWEPNGNSLAIGTDLGTVVVSRGSWSIDQILSDVDESADELDENEDQTKTSGENVVTAVAWSSAGQYLLVGCADARVFLWDISKRVVMKRWKAEALVQCVLWHPKHNSFILVDEIGQLGLVADIVPEHLPEQAVDKVSLEMPTIQSSPAKPNGKSNLKRIRKVEQSTGKKSSPKQTDDPSPFEFAFDTDGLDVDEEEELMDDDRQDGDASSDDNSSGDESHRRRKPRRGTISREPIVDKVQKPFNPSSTPPVEYATTTMRILYWNTIGVVLSYMESTFSIVEVEFADTARRSVRVKDHFGYSLGCVSESGLLLGASKTETSRGSVYFRPFSSWSTNSEWTQWFADNEVITVLALGSQFAAVSTEPNNIVRLFSLSGIQVDVFCLPGRIITMTAEKDHLAIVYNVQGSAVLRVDILRLSKHAEVVEVVHSGDVVLADGAKMEWIGFSGNGLELGVYDSSGVLYLLCGKHSWKRWVPMLMNAPGVTNCNWFWVAGVTPKSVLGVTCHSSERFPVAKPRPPLRSFPLVAPIIQPDSNNSKISVEERYFRSKLNVDRADLEIHRERKLYGARHEDTILQLKDKLYQTEVEMDKCTLALMQEACRSKQNVRALDLASRLRCKVSFKYAIELAKYFELSNLATRVEQLSSVKSFSIPEHELRGRRTITEVDGEVTGNFSGDTQTKKRKVSKVEQNSQHVESMPNRFLSRS